MFYLSSRNADPSGTYSTKAWLEKVIIVGAKKPNGVSIKDKGESLFLQVHYEHLKDDWLLLYQQTVIKLPMHV